MARGTSVTLATLLAAGLVLAPPLTRTAWANGVPPRVFTVIFETSDTDAATGPPELPGLSAQLSVSFDEREVEGAEGIGALAVNQATRVIPYEYSDGYRKRAKVHRIASFTLLPLFATQAVLGGSLYSSPSSGKRNAHRVVAGAIVGLFAVNTVTGVWNLIEARKDPHRRARRLTHGLFMLSADAAFLTTLALAPRSDGGGSRPGHRAAAITAISLATTGYLIMLLGGD